MFYLLLPTVSPFLRLYWKIFRIPGRENVPKGGKIYATNHCSNAEGVVLNMLHMRPVKFLGKSELFKNPIASIGLKGFAVIPINRGASDSIAFENAVKELKKGNYVGIFPEGTRGNGRDLLPPHTGVIRLALLADVPIVPVGISGAKKAWPKGAFFPRPRKIWVRIGEPYKVPKPPRGREYSYEELKELARDLLFNRIEPLIDVEKNF
ncbi:MAG: lysophospholipid acyltransferase family protein [Thermoplasmatota archaeon]